MGTTEIWCWMDSTVHRKIGQINKTANKKINRRINKSAVARRYKVITRLYRWGKRLRVEKYRIIYNYFPDGEIQIYIINVDSRGGIYK